jgi:hypothetical protein
MAQRLRDDLRARGIEVFDFPVGHNLVLDINQKLGQSDYFVLLWSQAAVDRRWVGAEWSAAFSLELLRQRSFLFVVRLDSTPLPPLLAPRHYLDAAAQSWDELVNELVSAWHGDRAVGDPVLPAPCPATLEDTGRNIVLRVHNRALSVAHVIAVPEKSTGRQLASLVRAALNLPDCVERFGGAVGMRFCYRLLDASGTISDHPGRLADIPVSDGDTIDLEVQVEAFGPEGPSPAFTYRKGAPTSLSPTTTRSLVNSAFGHLIPW